MKKLIVSGLFAFLFAVPGVSQTGGDENTFKLALPAHAGQLQWRAEGFKIVESSAKPNGHEIGIRGKDGAGRLTFLGFLFLPVGKMPVTSSTCRDGALDAMRKGNPTLKMLTTSQLTNPDSLPVEFVTYSESSGHGKTVYSSRAFIATGEVCGDLEFYSDNPISAEDPQLKKIFATFDLDMNYVPQFGDIFVYAQLLYARHAYQAAAPLFEQALGKLGDGKDKETVRRVTTDQAGMAYGMSGNIPKARALFEAAIVKDPDYPLYYYNLACADAEENKLKDARAHLQQAFDRKANVIHGETMPDPTKDDSFTPYRSNKNFWAFIESLR